MKAIPEALYTSLSVPERMNLVLQALQRNDTQEADRIRQTTPTEPEAMAQAHLLYRGALLATSFTAQSWSHFEGPLLRLEAQKEAFGWIVDMVRDLDGAWVYGGPPPLDADSLWQRYMPRLDDLIRLHQRQLRACLDAFADWSGSVGLEADDLMAVFLPLTSLAIEARRAALVELDPDPEALAHLKSMLNAIPRYRVAFPWYHRPA